MTITLEEMRRRGHEQVMFVQDPQAGLRAINAGGLVNVYVEMHGYDQRRALRLARQIDGRLRVVFALARELNLPTSVAADRIAETRLATSRIGAARTKAA